MHSNVLSIPAFSAEQDAHVRTPVLGKHGDRDFHVDLGRLLSTRLLIQAASGGGKSWALRRLLEETQSLVHQVVIDPDGELATLAEGYDYLVCSPDSTEVRLTPHSGAAVANAIYRSRRSAILSLGEFELDDMRQFVADFCTGLMRMPQDQWHHLLFACDEAQLFAPQHDKAESKKPMIDLAGRGRKRGLGLVAATQRISQLHKGVVAQLENKLIGLTTLDVDVERAADQIGMRVNVARDMLRKLPNGTFVAYGPALSYDLTQVRIGSVRTRHGALGQFGVTRHEPVMSRDDLISELQSAVASSESACESAMLVPSNIDLFPRFEAIRPLLANQTAEAIQRRAAELGVGVSSIHRWLRAYNPAEGPGSIEGQRRAPKLIARLRSLESHGPKAATGGAGSGHDQTPVARRPDYEAQGAHTETLADVSTADALAQWHSTVTPGPSGVLHKQSPWPKELVIPRLQLSKKPDRGSTRSTKAGKQDLPTNSERILSAFRSSKQKLSVHELKEKCGLRGKAFSGTLSCLVGQKRIERIVVGDVVQYRKFN